MHEIPLGKHTAYPEQYAPEILFAIPRAHNRQSIQVLDGALPFRGYDLWRAYELSWLNARGKPQIMLGEFLVPATSPNLVESKSLKLYLNSLNQTRFDSAEHVKETIAHDLSAVAGAPVMVQFTAVQDRHHFSITAPEGESLDSLEITIEKYTPSAALLRVHPVDIADESLYSDLFKSNCPVTSQPDWGTVVIQYRGPRIERESLLAYLVSYRHHEGFHEDCAERIFVEILQQCRPEFLGVTIHFLRRGGLEIVPVRSTEPALLDFPASRLIRQ